MQVFKQLAAAVLLCAVAFSSQAQWRTTARVDAMTDKEMRSAMVVSKEGYSFSISRSPETGRVWALFMIPEGSLDLVDNKGLQMRLDKNPPHTMTPPPANMERYTGKMWSWTPRSVDQVIWHGKDSDGRSLFLKELMTSTTLLVRFPIAAGGARDVSFDITGAGPVIAQLLDIPETVDAAQEARIKAYNETFRAEMRRCNTASSPSSCISRVATCSKSADNDIAKLTACTAQ